MKADESEKPDTGRMGFRWPEEPPDGRPVIDQRPFWRNRSEQLTYEHAAETHPRRPGEGPGTYIARLASIVAGRLVKSGVRRMPDPEPMSDAEWNERNNELLKQLEPEPK